MRRQSIVLVVLLAITPLGCLPAATDSATGAPSLAGATPSASVFVRVPLPSGFPVLPGAGAEEMPAGDPDLIGLWESDQLGSAAYDFYRVALPEAGYAILGLYPGGDVALIRFRAPGGGIWQLVTHGAPGGLVAIEVRLDRP